MADILLASASPRRRDLLEQVGFRVVVRPVDVDEAADDRLAPPAWAEAVARRKALAVDDGAFGSAIAAVAADTVVHTADGGRLGKPTSREDAAAMLHALSGRAHHVSTGVCLRGPGGRTASFAVTTRVTFRSLSVEDIDAYLQTDEPWDKAGAYGIQGRAAVFVSSMDGCYANVVGLPVSAVVARLREHQWLRGLPWEAA